MSETGIINKYQYVPPATPTELIDCTSYILNFEDRKFIQIGLSPSDNLNIQIDIITASRYVRITPDFFNRLQSMMGRILSVILDPPMKTKNDMFLSEDSMILSRMVYKGENVLIIESKVQDGCRVLLNRKDLFMLQNLVTNIIHCINRKNMYTRPLVLKQSVLLQKYLRKELVKDENPKTIEELQIFIARINQDAIDVSKDEPNFINDIKMLSVKQLVENYDEKEECDSLMNEEQSFSTPRLPYGIITAAPRRKRQSKPMDVDENSQQFNLSPSYLPSYSQLLPMDENDGPSYFNVHLSPPPSPLQYSEQDPSLQSVQWRTKRKLYN